MRSELTFLAAAVMLALGSLGASAQEGPERNAFGDWAKQCEKTGETGERCYLIQTVKAEGRPVMVVIVAYSPGRERVAAMIDVPLGMHIPTGLEVRAPGGVVKRIDFEQCLPTGCRAMLPMDDDLLEALKKGDAAAIAGRARDGANLELPISATGFVEAFEAL